MGMSVGASMGMQLAGKGQNSKAGSLISEYDRLGQQKNQIEKNKSLSKEEKEKRLKLIEQQMNELQQQISMEQQKDNSKQQVKNQQREQEKLENTLPPKVADMVMQMHKMMKTAMNVDSAQSNPQDAQDATQELKADEATAATAENANATGATDTTDSVPKTNSEFANKVVITDAHGTASNESANKQQVIPNDILQKNGREQLTDLIEQIREENEKSSELEKIPEGMLVDEYR
jgi:hypothetical protein